MNPAALTTAPHQYLPIYTTATVEMTNLTARTEGIGPSTHPGVMLFGVPQQTRGPPKSGQMLQCKPGIAEHSRGEACISCLNRRLVMYQREWEEGQMERQPPEIDREEVQSLDVWISTHCDINFKVF